MTGASEKIEFQAEVIRVQTMADGAIRVVLDMAEDNIMQMAQLAECKRWGAVLSVVCEPMVRDDGNTEKPRKIHI